MIGGEHLKQSAVLASSLCAGPAWLAALSGAVPRDALAALRGGAALRQPGFFQDLVDPDTASM